MHDFISYVPGPGPRAGFVLPRLELPKPHLGPSRVDDLLYVPGPGLFLTGLKS